MPKADTRSWYSVRCVFRLLEAETYEERLTLWRAASEDEAIEKAEEDAKGYAATGGNVYLGLAQCYWVEGDPLAPGTTVFSLCRDSTLDGDDYLDTFFDTGNERERRSEGSS